MRGVERMRAVVLGRGGATELRDVPVPRPRDGEILIRVTAVGLCGSDVEKLADGTGIEGSVLGHELAGVVEGGALPAGTRVALAHRVPCGACRDCLAGHETCCPQYLASGLRPGGFAELLVAPASHAGTVVLPLPDEVSDLAGTFVEPLGCIVRGAARVPHGIGVVAGCGAVGRLFARLLAARGDTVRTLDADPARLMAAAEDGFEPAATDELLDFAVVTAPQALDAALALLRPGGTCLVFAAPATPVPVLLDRIYRSELVLVGSRSATPASLREALELIASGRVQVEDLATDVLPLAAFGEGLARYRSRQALKVVFRP
jgi:L-iditol 2-dehydrogenase